MTKDHIKEAAEAHSTLTVFAAVAALLEGGLVYCPEAYKAADQIIRIANSVQQRMLRKYDREVARAGKVREKIDKPL